MSSSNSSVDHSTSDITMAGSWNTEETRTLINLSIQGEESIQSKLDKAPTSWEDNTWNGWCGLWKVTESSLGQNKEPYSKIQERNYELTVPLYMLRHLHYSSRMAKHQWKWEGKLVILWADGFYTGKPCFICPSDTVTKWRSFSDHPVTSDRWWVVIYNILLLVWMCTACFNNKIIVNETQVPPEDMDEIYVKGLRMMRHLLTLIMNLLWNNHLATAHVVTQLPTDTSTTEPVATTRSPASTSASMNYTVYDLERLENSIIICTVVL